VRELAQASQKLDNLDAAINDIKKNLFRPCEKRTISPRLRKG